MSGMILVFLERPDAARRLLTSAVRVAELMGGARIMALVVRTLPETTIMPTEEVLTRHDALRIRENEKGRVAAIRMAFDQWYRAEEAAGETVIWCDAEGTVKDVMREHGTTADVIVLSRPYGDLHLSAQPGLHAALFDTDRPLLVVPPSDDAPFGRRIVIAWRDGRPATRAVLSALRCDTRPEKVFVLAGVKEGESEPVPPAILAEHGIESELHIMRVGSDVFGRSLLNRAHALGADLIVMGAYRHSPLEERLLGGVTRFMLAYSDLPLLMRH